MGNYKGKFIDKIVEKTIGTYRGENNGVRFRGQSFLTMEPDPVVFHCDFFGPRGFLSESKTSEPDPVVFLLNLCEPMVFHLKPSFHGFSSSNNLFSHIINSNID